jgi:hypothetical protein
MLNRTPTTNPTFITFWKKHQFKIIVFGSLTVLLVLYIINGKKQGTWSLSYSYVPDTKTVKFTRQSKGEVECRRVLEKLFMRPFPNRRPAFLMNNVTGKPLELDCYNEGLRLACEYNGKQHYQYTPGMHKNHEAFRLQQYRDEMKKKLCEENDVHLISVSYMVPVESIENYIREKVQLAGYTLS